MSPVCAWVFSPSFAIDLAGVRVVDGDYDLTDLHAVLGQSRVHEAALQLYCLSPRPTLAYVCGPGSARALAAHLRLGGLCAVHVDDGDAVENIRRLVAELGAGNLQVLVSVKRLAGLTPIPGVSGVMLARPTLSAITHNRFLGRLAPANGEVAIYDLVGNFARHGAPPEWNVTPVTGPACDVVRDPHIARLEGMPHKNALAWAGKNIERLVLVQRAKGFKLGWVYNAVKSFDQAAADHWWKEQKESGTR